jgi:hypothetical protein
MGRVRSFEPVTAGQGGRHLGGGPVYRTQVQPGQQSGEDADLLGSAVAQRPAEYLRQQQDRADACHRPGSHGPEQGGDSLAERVTGRGGVDQRVGVEGVH